MSESTHKAILSAVAKVLRPVVRLCLKHGVSEALFNEVCRQVFVSESPRLLLAEGQKPTVSAIASLTGLSRKEVSRLQQLDTDGLLEISQRRDRATRVLSGWLNDPVYIGQGHRRVIPLHGDTGSFDALVREYGGDVTPKSMLQLLNSAGNVELLDQSVALISEAYLPAQTSSEKLEVFGTDGAELLDTIEFNIGTSFGERRFQRKVSNGRVAKDALPHFRELTAREAMSLLERLDAWLAVNEADDLARAKSNYVSVGIYFYEHSEEDEDDPNET